MHISHQITRRHAGTTAPCHVRAWAGRLSTQSHGYLNRSARSRQISAVEEPRTKKRCSTSARTSRDEGPWRPTGRASRHRFSSISRLFSLPTVGIRPLILPPILPLGRRVSITAGASAVPPPSPPPPPTAPTPLLEEEAPSPPPLARQRWRRAGEKGCGDVSPDSLWAGEPAARAEGCVGWSKTEMALPAPGPPSAAPERLEAAAASSARWTSRQSLA